MSGSTSALISSCELMKPRSARPPSQSCGYTDRHVHLCFHLFFVSSTPSSGERSPRSSHTLLHKDFRLFGELTKTLWWCVLCIFDVKRFTTTRKIDQTATSSMTASHCRAYKFPSSTDRAACSNQCEYMTTRSRNMCGVGRQHALNLPATL